ncbi:MAG: NAD(P)-dependent oxidoreductase [Planctomycetota bacterium]|nr:NAD(P)-dependent oxidoreductase [Planctomycetota bacterium]
MNGDKHVGVIGLGLMGTAITERLLENGYAVSVWNRSREKANSLISKGAVWSDNPLADCDRVIVSLYTSKIVAEVINRLSSGLHDGQFIIDITTGEPSDAVTLAHRLAERGVHYLDAPISGSSVQTRQGEATVMVGGVKSDFDACTDLWSVLGGRTYYIGPCGSAAKVKLVTNLVLGLNRVALAEGLVFAATIGLPPEVALEVLQGSAAYSKAMDIKGRKMIEGDFSVQAKLSQHFKDVRMMLDAATTAGIEMPLTQTHAELLARAEAAGFGQLDNSAIINIYRKPNT